MPKNRGKRNRGKRHGIAHTVSAPKGMIQAVSTWDLNHIIPIV
jgi:hypothetical protein